MPNDSNLVDLSIFDEMIREHRVAGDIMTLTPELGTSLGIALGTMLGRSATVVTARDYREDSRILKRSVSAGFMAAGVNMIDLHACPLPVLLFSLKRFSASAGIIFHATHRNPETINIRVFNEFGIEVNIIEKLKEFSKSNMFQVKRQDPNNVGHYLATSDAPMIYSTALLNFYTIQSIQPGFKVVVDMALSPQSDIISNILANVGVKVITLNSYKPTKIPEVLPNPISLNTISRTILATKADFGVAFDPSGGRIVFLDESGKIITADEITSLFVDFKAMGRSNAKFVMSETMGRLPYEDSKYKVIRVPDVPGKIARTIRQERAIWGASDQGAFYFPSFISDAEPILAILTLLTILSRQYKDNIFLSELINSVNPPANYGLPVKIGKAPPELVLRKIEQISDKYEITKVIDTLVGLKLVFENGAWTHVMTSMRTDKFNIQIGTESDAVGVEIYEKTKEIIKDAMEKVIEEIEN